MPPENHDDETRQGAAEHIRELGQAIVKSADLIANAENVEQEVKGADLFMATGMHIFEHIAKELARSGIMGMEINLPGPGNSPRPPFGNPALNN